MTVYVRRAVHLEDSTGDILTVEPRDLDAGDTNEERWLVGGKVYATDADLRAFSLALLTDLLDEPWHAEDVRTLSGESIRPYGSDDPPL